MSGNCPCDLEKFVEIINKESKDLLNDKLKVAEKLLK